ncbi:MAG: DUF475 domain-containing protein [Cyanobacteriota bacterium]|nr:DUF475 domain-containing protein [Cyanobacteriota bacterium]
MVKYFHDSIFVTIAGILIAYFWGEHVKPGGGLMAVFIACVLAILEISLSFDNAVVNAMKLKNMSKKWQHRFLTWGIVIAVFGMRFLFPILVVAVFAHLDMLTVTKIALNDSDKYAHYLSLSHAPIVTFGGLFLTMLFLYYFFNNEKKIHWITCVEKPLSYLDHFKGIEIVISLLIIIFLQTFIPEEEKVSVIIAGMVGIITFLTIEGISQFLEHHEQERLAKCVSSGAACTGLVSFLYLELIDASFSLDGVLGAFALSDDIIIIAVGLGIGAMFVRSLTLLIVDTNTLAKFRYLEHGAHWAIGALAVIMLVTTVKQVPEVVTGLIGLFFIVAALISSIVYNKKHAQDEE